MINNHPESIGPSSQDPSTEWGGMPPLEMIGQLAWHTYLRWMLNPENQGKPLPSEEIRQITERAQTLGLSEDEIQQVMYEGEIAAQIQADPSVAAGYSISDLEAKSLSYLSPFACVARYLRLLGMIQQGQIAAFIVKQTGEDVLPQLQKQLADVIINP